MRRMRGEVGKPRGAAQSGSTRSSFTHLIHLYLTQNDQVQLEAANRPVPCKHKGIREYPDNFGSDRIKAVAFRGSQGQMRWRRPDYFALSSYSAEAQTSYLTLAREAEERARSRSQ
jgi:hypothetical protein